ncbi:MAG: 16S rRNA (guanine(527)-N(7))-methyltransferase RsmG [Bacteroidales bacterium]|nr:16S rRNA (guanine(527)-N(7))-methyltransferase RsmG [Bacteroidales bacterium]
MEVPDFAREELFLIYDCFKNLSEEQKKRFESLWELYTLWNERINLVSRKDILHLYKHHVLHSLSIAWKTTIIKNQLILDLGTGGGFPGIPLAILFPETRFLLIDSVGKKIMAVENIIKSLDLKNTFAKCERVENLRMEVDMIVARAVAPLGKIIKWTENLNFLAKHGMPRYVLLKGQDVFSELRNLSCKYEAFPLKHFHPDPFFEEKFLLHIF